MPPEEVEEPVQLAHGVMPADILVECPACHGLGVVRYDVPVTDPRFGQLFDCPDCRGTARQERLRKLSRLTGELLDKSLDNFDGRGNLDLVVPAIRAWLKSKAGWLTMSGPSGTGKTHLMAAIANLCISSGIPVLYTTVADLLADLQATFHPTSKLVYSSLFANVLEVDVLCLDEAEKFQATEWAQVQVFRMLEHRSRNQDAYRTVLATNTDLRPLLVDPGSVDLYPRPLFPNYIESRILAGRLIVDFWLEGDIRPILAARQAEEDWPQERML